MNVDQLSAGANPGTTLDDLTYQLALDFDPTAGVETTDYNTYTSWMTIYNVAQNSHNYARYQLFGYQIDPTVPGVFDISLTAYDAGVEVAKTE